MFRLSRVQLQRLFKELDRNGDGVVSAEEVAGLLEGLGLGVDAQRGELELLIGGQALGYVDFMFFCETLMKGKRKGNDNDGAADHHERETMEGDLRGAFRVFDLDGDGFISSEELRIALSRLGLRDDDDDDDDVEDCRRMIDSYDSNSDGFLDFEEFKDMMMPTVTGQS